MLETSQPWSLFGFDLSQGLHYFRSGWKDFLWNDDSAVLHAIDEVVEVHVDAGPRRYYQAGRPVPAPGEGAAQGAVAVLLPDRLVLSRTMRLPAAAEAEIDAAVALEVRSNSPFPAGDTRYGWSIVRRDPGELEIVLVISSLSAVMEYGAEQLDSHDSHSYEVWAEVGDRVVVLSGFGEDTRNHRNRRRLARAALMVAYCLAGVVVFSALSAGMKYLELQKVRAMYAQLQSTSSDAVQFRSGLSSSKALVATVNELMEEYPDPLIELNRLASVLEDNTWLSAVDIKGRQIRIEGEAGEAAAVMQALIDNPAYSKVVAPVAIKKVRSGKEHFALQLTLESTDDGQ